MTTKIKEIKVLNIAQPNAHNVMFNGKNVENRSMPTNLRGTIAIYASATYQKKRFEKSDVKREDCSFGCIIGFVDVVDCIVEAEVTKKTKKWFFGEYGYVLDNVRVLEKPIEVKPPKGAIIWWTLTGKDVEKCLKQIDSKSFKEPHTITPSPDKPKAKSRKRSLLIPSKELAKIIGPEPRKQNKMIEDFIGYLEDNELGFEKGKDFYFKIDKKLKLIFKGQKEVKGSDFMDYFEEHTRVA